MPLAARLCVSASFAGFLFLTSCNVPTSPPVASMPEAGNVHYADFMQGGKAYRAKLTVDHRLFREASDTMTGHIKATGSIFAYNKTTGAYDIPLTAHRASGEDRGFRVRRIHPNQTKVHVGETGGTGGSGWSGLHGWNGYVTIGLDPASNSRPDAPLTVKTDVNFRISPNTEAEGPVLANVCVPLSWRVTARPDSAKGLDMVLLEPDQR